MRPPQPPAAAPPAPILAPLLAILLLWAAACPAPAADLALPPERLIPAKEPAADLALPPERPALPSADGPGRNAPDAAKAGSPGAKPGPAGGKGPSVRERTTSTGVDNALGDPSVTTRRTKVGGGASGVVPPVIRMPRIDIPRVPPPVVPAPRAPAVARPQEPVVAGAAAPARTGPPAGRRGIWRTLEPGLEHAEIPFMPVRYEEILLDDEDAEPPRPTTLTALRIDPARFSFELCAAARAGTPLPLGLWADRLGLTAAINAGMYLPDGRTSTGYMRQGSYVNNGRVGARLGAFLLAGPDLLGRVAGLPEAMVADRDAVNVARLQKRYRLAIQNYRIIDFRRRILWPPDGRRNAVAAVAGTGDGRILFLFCQEPVETHALAQHLLNLPLDVRTVMYVEGGAQAGLLVRAGGILSERYGRSAVSMFMAGAAAPALPNVIGVRRRPERMAGSGAGRTPAAPAAARRAAPAEKAAPAP